MSTLDQRAAALNAAWRDAQDLAPIPWVQVDERERAIWHSVAATAVPGATDERDQWTVAVVDGTTSKAKPHIVLTSTNGEVVLSGEVRSSRRGAQDTAQQMVEAGLRGFRREQ